MEALFHIQRVIEYVDENIKSEIEIDDLAVVAGFSKSHFCQIFKTAVGMTVLSFVTNRRLKHAMYEAHVNGSKIVDVALEYGFNTHAGFYKAFKKQYGCSPKEFLKLGSVKPPRKIDLWKERIILNETEVKRLLKNWDIDIQGEFNNAYGIGGDSKYDHVWKIGDRYIFKSGIDVNGLTTHIGINRALHSEGMKSGIPVKTREGKDFLVIDERYYVLLHAVGGDMLKIGERFNGDVQSLGREYGEAIGTLHKVLKKYDGEIEAVESDLFYTLEQWALPNTRRIMEQWKCPLPEEFFQEVLREFKKLAPHLPKQVIHRDPNPSNIMFKDGKFEGFIDFEISRRDMRILDPCYCATGLLSEEWNRGLDKSKWIDMLKSILDGYDSEVGITEEERKAIPYVIYTIQMIFIAYLDGNEKLKQMAMDNREMLLWIWQEKILNNI